MNTREVSLPANPVTTNVYLLPGDVQVATGPTRLSTVLGSCVAVCLYDPEAGAGGMNHFLLPGNGDGVEGNPLRWSGPSLQALWMRMLSAGANPASVRAKVFGGACISAREVPERLRIGDHNIAAALDFLQQHHIAVVSRDVGGNAGRKLIFDADTGAAWIKLLAPRPP